MLLYVFDLCALSDIEGVDSAVLAILNTAIMDAASCNYQNISAVLNMKIVINSFAYSALGKNYGDMNALALSTCLDININSGQILFLLNNNIFGGSFIECISINSDRVCALRNTLKIGNLAKKVNFKAVELLDRKSVV